MLKTLTGLGGMASGMAIDETSEAGSYFTGELRPGATVDSEDNARICQPELGQECCRARKQAERGVELT